jgi:hypothetical protein
MRKGVYATPSLMREGFSELAGLSSKAFEACSSLLCWHREATREYSVCFSRLDGRSWRKRLQGHQFCTFVIDADWLRSMPCLKPALLSQVTVISYVYCKILALFSQIYFWAKLANLIKPEN